MICGQFRERFKLVAIAECELIRARDLLSTQPLYANVPEEFFQYGPGYHRLSGLVLDPRGFFKAEELATGSDFLGSGCVECWQEISKGVMPIGALANGLWTGAGQIKELADLTWIEEKLIARTHVSIQLQKCRLRRNLSWDHFYSQSRIKGHIVTFPMAPTAVLQRLPLPLERLSELIKVVFVSRREISHTEASALSFFLVRRNKVLRALQWLVGHNPLYAGVEIDEHAIDHLPLEGLPREIYETITFSNRMSEDIASHSRYDEADDSGSFSSRVSLIRLEPDEDEEMGDEGIPIVPSVPRSSTGLSGASEQASGSIEEMQDVQMEFQDASRPILQCCGVVDVEGTSVSAESKIYRALHGLFMPHRASQHDELPTEFPTHRYWGNSDTSPTSVNSGADLVEVCTGGGGLADEYAPEHLGNAFPTLFPFGKGLLADPSRKKSLSWERHIVWQLKQSHQMFGRHEIYLFVVFNILQRRRICLGARLMTRRSDAVQVSQLLEDLDFSQVTSVIAREQNRSFFKDPTLGKIMKLTSVANGHVKGSREEVAKRRAEIRGENIRFGSSKFFITLNPDDVKHPLILGLCGDEEILWWKSGSDSDFNHYLQSRFKLVAAHPVLQAQFFDIIMRTVLEILFGFGAKEKIGILGEVASHYFMIEAQGKGTLHAHGLVWLTDGTSSLLYNNN